ncbi:MAG: hypothetical protein LC797_11520, partial [Chloroflexi bacterium]|nr:hypothetical protein [Chloroflexota bacterium]
AYTAFLEFENGTPATIVYSGYGHFSMSELLSSDRSPPRPAMPTAPRTPADEAAMKEAMRYTGPRSASANDAPTSQEDSRSTRRDETHPGNTTHVSEDSPTSRRGDALPGSTERSANSLGLFGLTLVTCARGDLRESAAGLFVYQHGQLRPIPVADELRGAAELDELYQAVRFDKPIVHDGRWGEATLEVCLAIHESARTHAEVRLSRQTALPD